MKKQIRSAMVVVMLAGSVRAALYTEDFNNVNTSIPDGNPVGGDVQRNCQRCSSGHDGGRIDGDIECQRRLQRKSLFVSGGAGRGDGRVVESTGGGRG